MPTALSARLRRALPRPRLTRRRIVIGAVVLAVLVGALSWAVRPSSPGYRITSQMITVQTGPAGTTPISLDTTYYQPDSASAAHPAAAVLLAHGFGGTKDDVADDAKDLASRGYAVLAWTAEGFGESGGQIHLDSPDWEVKDAQHLIDWLSARPEVRKDGPRDPRVAAVGASYGGGLALMLAGYDRRVDAIVPQITWNDLGNAFLPSATGAGASSGVFKKGWAGIFFTGGAVPAALPGSGAAVPGAGGATLPGAGGALTPPTGATPTCGRFAADLCAAYLSIATTGRATPDQLALLERSSPASVLDRIHAPALLIQGQADSLFPLSEADANAKGIAANGTPVQVDWFIGGHDGGNGPQSDQDRNRYLTVQWLDHYLLGKGSAPSTSFTYSRLAGIDANTDSVVALGYSVHGYPGLSGQSSTTVTVAGPPQPAVNPPNGTPAGISTVPGVGGGPAGATGGTAQDVPGQHADFYSEPLKSTVDVVGTPTVRVRAASPTGQAVLFVKLYDVDPHSGATLPDGLVAPVRLTGLPATLADAPAVTVTLPGIVHQFQAGHRLRVTVATSDQAYLSPPDPTVYQLAVTGGVRLPTVHSTPIASPDLIWRWILAGLAAALAIGTVVAIVLGRRRHRKFSNRSGSARLSPRDDPDQSHLARADLADIPLVVSGLRKEYGDGFVAVSKVDFTVRRGQVVGLLGPNGAGKTTSLRVLMGLTKPTAGDIYVFGHRLVSGAPVLSRLGALVEGPGFLPHLSGLANLQLYWRSTGRPLADARLDEALDIAGLGDAVHRRIKTYSHGMRQRLAIAQAMLGLPELLVLDEPTDGLDPPQIAEMRRVLRRYATDGRAVLVSSHLLAEVEQTCTHVVVVHKGTVVADGPVDDIVGDSPSVQFDVSDPATATEVLNRSGVRSVSGEGNGTLIADLDGADRADVVAELVRAGVGVNRVVPRRRLEDAFLSLVGGDTKASGER
ncbi:alpha/beta fold hydrolase [Rugosimonospora africana]|uniref:ABC transporter ATP-binding protein n=1 Tax=Rugosimonospora africana TaxID=556532 RepID=A0A8J3VT03_9ACTN|nr:alpha/beta fold hydrolase [Rugosimonospora africana]GIH17574.1 ABC transporter ATP-binding protein [Rugosimonospora africana]